jgi:hypothetical protein
VGVVGVLGVNGKFVSKRGVKRRVELGMANVGILSVEAVGAVDTLNCMLSFTSTFDCFFNSGCCNIVNNCNLVAVLTREERRRPLGKIMELVSLLDIVLLFDFSIFPPLIVGIEMVVVFDGEVNVIEEGILQCVSVVPVSMVSEVRLILVVGEIVSEVGIEVVSEVTFKVVSVSDLIESVDVNIGGDTGRSDGSKFGEFETDDVLLVSSDC